MQLKLKQLVATSHAGKTCSNCNPRRSSCFDDVTSRPGLDAGSEAACCDSNLQMFAQEFKVFLVMDANGTLTVHTNLAPDSKGASAEFEEKFVKDRHSNTRANTNYK